VHLYGFGGNIKDDADLGAALEARKYSPNFGPPIHGE
jgi:hypothetical protein